MENKETETTNTSTENVGSVITQGVSVVSSDHSETTSTKELATTASDGPIRNHDTTPKNSDEANTSPESTAQSQSNSTTTASPKPTSYVPPVKRFSAVNINKKFLEKASSSTAPSSISHLANASSTAKQNGAIARPTPQSAHSHSRLVTTKLTASSSSGTTGPGWSRPSSVTPPVPSTNNASTNGSSASNSASTQNAAQTTVAGKLIAPQARNPGLRQKLDGKPAWGNVAQNALKETMSTANDFPTAAEAAQGRKAKAASQKAAETAAETPTAQEQAMHDTADAFRGVHLDPNAHHWDEMDEDDNDDYLGEVIEFGDGRQYTIQVNDSTTLEAKHDGNGKDDASGNHVGQAMGAFKREERFADDFDRSWPRNRGEPPRHSDDANHGRSARSEVSPTVSVSPTSMRDWNQSRVLFNERSNRMEPYDGGGRPNSGSSQYRRVGGDAWGHPSSRYERDPPPHGSRAPMQVLQKSHRPGDNEPSGVSQGPFGSRDRRDMEYVETGSTFSRASDERRSRRFSNTHTNVSSASSRERRPVSRGGSRAGDSVNGHLPGKPPSEYAGSRRDSTYSNDHRHGHFERQLPPHMLGSPLSPSVQLKPSDDAHSGVTSLSSQAPATPAHGPPQSSLEKPHVQGSAMTEMPTDTDLEDLRKQFLHERAEQARRRREQEEEERAKAQERARQKALELEAKLAPQGAPKQEAPKQEAPKAESAPEPSKAALQVTESQVLNVIEDAIKSAAPPTVVEATRSQEADSRNRERPPVPNAWAQRNLERSSSGRNVGAGPPNRPSVPAPVNAAESTDSWRKRQSLPSAVETIKLRESISIASTITPRPTLAHDSPVEHALNLNPGENVEVFDFSDLGKLMDSEPKEPREDAIPPSKARRPGAADFFDDVREQNANKSTTVPPEHHNELPHNSPPGEASNVVPIKQELPSLNPMQSPSLPAFQNGVPASPGRMMKQSSFREAPLSALDDTMSRIKGVLDGMQSSAPPATTKSDSKESSPRQTDERLPNSGPRNGAPASSLQVKRWVPPALRPPPVPDLFDITVLNLPFEGKSAVVKLPQRSRKVEPLSRRQLNFTRTPSSPVRWDILSFDPPVEGMTKRNLSVNDVLFGKPPYPGRRVRYRVWIPKSRRTSRPVVQRDPVGTAVGMVKTNSFGAFGRPSMADTSSWRQAKKLSAEPSDHEAPLEETALNVTSRSPPPESGTKAEDTSMASSTATTSGSDPSHSSRKPKGPVGMPEGADVAFSRNLNADIESTKSSFKVNFTVTSELDDKADVKAESAASSSSLVAKTDAETKGSLETSIGEEKNAVIAKSGRTSEQSTPAASALLLEGSDAKSPSAPSVVKGYEETRTVTPPLPPSSSMSSSIWGKSPSRAPDREHLKAVWSQASDRETIPTVNSLREIADDLPAVPFSIHEAKLDDDGTPPPFAPPARMSASDVTRAFQTVPSGPSGSTSFRPPTFSPTLSPRVPKPAPIGMHPPPSMVNGARPVYMGYPTVQSHSPSPTMMYPQLPQHVMANQIRGSPSSPYGQPVWMPMQSHAPQHSPQLMRAQPASPYGAPIHQYQPQGALYPPANVPHNAQAPLGSYAPGAHQQQRMPLISPVLPAASPVGPHYSSSPMLLQVPPPGGIHTSQPYPGAMNMGRGSVPVQASVDNRQPVPHMAHGQAPMPYPGHTPGYSHVPPHSFVRPSW